MFPIRDLTPTKSYPFVNNLIIAINVGVFLVEITAPNFENFVYAHSFIPARFDLFNLFSYGKIIESIFLHGGWFHLLSNMWFLHIFGDNVEDVFGHIPYFLFYLIAGIIGTLAQYFLLPAETIPMLGASGAISGIAGAYFVFFRRSTIETLVPTLFIFTVIELPVWFFLGYWFFLQVFSGVGSLVQFDINQGGVAWFAHVGGFLYGFLTAQRSKKKMI